MQALCTGQHFKLQRCLANFSSPDQSLGFHSFFGRHRQGIRPLTNGELSPQSTAFHGLLTLPFIHKCEHMTEESRMGNPRFTPRELSAVMKLFEIICIALLYRGDIRPPVGVPREACPRPVAPRV